MNIFIAKGLSIARFINSAIISFVIQVVLSSKDSEDSLFGEGNKKGIKYEFYFVFSFSPSKKTHNLSVFFCCWKTHRWFSRKCKLFYDLKLLRHSNRITIESRLLLDYVPEIYRATKW